MGVGPNYVLDKGFVATGATDYKFGELVVQVGDGTECAHAGAGAVVIGVCQENIDAGRVSTGKAVVGVRLLGISRVIAGAAVAVGDSVAPDANSRAVPVARAAAGAQPAPVAGRALTAATAAGEHIDVLLTPGATF